MKKLSPAFAELFAVFSRAKRGTMWTCSGAFVTRRRAELDAEIEKLDGRAVVILPIHVRRPPVKP